MSILREVKNVVRKTIRELCPTVRDCLQTTAAIATLIKITSTLDGGDVEAELHRISNRYGVPFNAVRDAFYRGSELYSDLRYASRSRQKIK